MPAQSRLLHLLHLASPALPIGSFHFSQGLEYAVQASWVRDEASALEWIGGLAEHALGTLDLPVLLRLHRAAVEGRLADFLHWNAFLGASRETEELRAEDRHMGAALAKVLADLGVPGIEEPAQAVDASLPAAHRSWVSSSISHRPGVPTSRAKPGSRGTFSFAAMFAHACAHWEIPGPDALHAYAWIWTESQALAAVKLVPLGQRAGQRMLKALIPRLAEAVTRAQTLTEDEIGVGTLMQAVASARHESQYTRLFRS